MTRLSPPTGPPPAGGGRTYARRLTITTLVAAILACVFVGAQAVAAKSGVSVPATLNGLSTSRSTVGNALKQPGAPLYVDSVDFYSLRQPDNLLVATLELAHLTDPSRFASADAQRTATALMGTTVPIVMRVGHQPVYLTSSRQLAIMVWFRGGYMYVLAIRSTYTQPKALLDAALRVGR